MANYQVRLTAKAVEEDGSVYGHLRVSSPRPPIEKLDGLTVLFDCKEEGCSLRTDGGYLIGYVNREDPVIVFGKVYLNEYQRDLIDRLADHFFQYFKPEHSKRVEVTEIHLERLSRFYTEDLIRRIAEAGYSLSFIERLTIDFTDWPESFEIVSK